MRNVENMFCVKCGTKIEEGARFCTKCGASVEITLEAFEKKQAEMRQAQQIVEQPVTPAVEEAVAPVVEESVKVETTPAVQEAVAPVVEQPVKVEVTPAVSETPKKEKKEKKEKKQKKQKTEKTVSKRTAKMIAFITSGVVAVAALACIGLFVVWPLLKPVTNQLVYISDNKLYYMPDVDKPEKVYFVDETNVEELNAWFGDDGTQLYYCKDEKGSLYNISVSKIKANSKQDGKYLKKIGEGASYSNFLGENTFVYIDNKSNLVRYNNGKEEKLAQDVVEIELPRNSNVVVYLTEKQDLCYMNLNDKEEKEIDSMVMAGSLRDSFDGKYIYYQRESVTENVGDLYCVTDFGSPVKIDEDVYKYSLRFKGSDALTYYKVETEEKPYIDFVEDDLLQSDKEIKTPTTKDMLTETNEKTAMKAILNDDKLYDFYTKKENKPKFYEYLYQNDEGYYCSNGGDHKIYYCTYNANKENGYKKAKWYYWDEEKEKELKDAYLKVVNRRELRKKMAEETIKSEVKSLYITKNGEPGQLVCDRVEKDICGDGEVVFYAKPTENNAKVKMSTIIQDGYDGNMFFLTIGQATKCDAKQFYWVDGKEKELDIEGSIYSSYKVSDQQYLLSISNGSQYGLAVAKFDGSTLSDVQMIDDANETMSSCEIIAENIYYISSKHELCCYKNGESKVLAKDIGKSAYVGFLEDGTSLYTEGDTLILGGDDHKTEIDKKVQGFRYAGENCIFYTKSEDLYYYNGKGNAVKLAKNVGENYEEYVAYKKGSLLAFRLRNASYDNGSDELDVETKSVEETEAVDETGAAQQSNAAKETADTEETEDAE